MKYIEVKIFTGVAGIEPILSLLMEEDIYDVVVQNPEDIKDLLNKEHDYDWDYIDESVLELENEEPSLTVYFELPEGRIEDDAVQKFINSYINEKISSIKVRLKTLEKQVNDGLFGCKVEGYQGFGRLEMISHVVNDEDWKNNWKEYFKPTRITDRIVVKPSWEEYESSPGDLVIQIDPGMAFGTGTHETTTLCLKLMEKYGAAEKSILDVGCGSGILSIAAGLLGAKEVLGVEIDPVAVKVGQDNVELNGFSQKIKVIEGDLTKGIDYKADLVVANIMADIVKMLSKDVPRHLNDGGIFISSGILTERKEDVVSAIKDCGFEIVEIAEQGEWCAIAAQKYQ